MNLVSFVQKMTNDFMDQVEKGLKWNNLRESEFEQFKITYAEKP